MTTNRETGNLYVPLVEAWRYWEMARIDSKFQCTTALQAPLKLYYEPIFPPRNLS